MFFRFLLIAVFFLPMAILWSQPIIQMPAVDNALLLEEEMARRSPGIAPQFAHPFEVSLTPEFHGEWEFFGDDKALWTLRINSSNAYSINLAFTAVHFPESASLFITGNGTGEIFGPFGEAFNRTYHELWTPIIGGDVVTIYLSIHPDEIDQLSLEISQVNHDYLNFRGALSGSCNLDVICGAQDGWPIIDNYRDIIQSVAVISTGGSTFCTGFLVNNANNDCTPFFMTARHCGINNNTAGSLVTYWNYYNSTCRLPFSAASGASGNGVLTDFNTGAIFRASYQPSDFTLVELSDPVSETANAFFAGWDATSANPDTSIAIHHPSTDEKRISFDFDPGTTTNYLQSGLNSNGTHIRVGNWEIGTTEPGSSGSPLFNQQKRVTGQLHGGLASCNSNTDDWYGRISVSWLGGGTPATSLKHWLDPDNSGILALDGRYQSACDFDFQPAYVLEEICAPSTVNVSFVVSENFDGTVSLSHSTLPTGVTLQNFPITTQPGANITFSVQVLPGASNGLYGLEILASQGDNSGIAILELGIAGGEPATAMLTEPQNNLTNASPIMTFKWEDQPGVVLYDLQVSNNQNFSPLEFNVNDLASSSYDTNLSPAQTYYWRVRAKNICGDGLWSETRSFTTSQIICNTVSASDLPITIGSGPPNTINSIVEIPGSGTISDVSIPNITGLHTYMSDLVFRLISPTGTNVILMANACGSQDNFNIGFSDAGLPGPIPCPPINSNVYQPVGSMASFNGQEAQGNWTLQIEDQASLDGGQLLSWDIAVCFAPNLDFDLYSDILPDSDIPIICVTAESTTFNVLLGTGYGEETEVSATLPSGVPLEVVFNPSVAAGGETIQIELLNFEEMPHGEFSFTLHTDDGINSNDYTATVLFDYEPAQTVLIYPANQSTVLTSTINFSWEALSDFYAAVLEIDVETGSFENPVYVTSVSEVSSHTVSTLEPGAYKWRIITQTSCGVLENPTEWVFTFQGTNTQHLLMRELIIKPNPSQHFLSIDFGNLNFERLKVSILDLNGKEYLPPQWLRENGIMIGDLPSGMYFLRLDSEYGIVNLPFVKQ